MTKASPVPGKTLLACDNHTLLMIDHQGQMAFATKSIDGVSLRNNTGLVASIAKEFNVPTILTSCGAKTFAGYLFPEIKDVFPNTDIIDRTTMNSWEDGHITDKVNSSGKNKIVICGLWTSVCVALPAISAVEQGFEVYFIADACGDITEEAHAHACTRMVLAGCRPITSLQYLFELQRDWQRVETYNGTIKNAIKYGGVFGLGIIYAQDMLPNQVPSHL
jgi:nicotinamidase-related amidase